MATKALGIFCKMCENMGDMNSELYRDSGGVSGEGMRAKCARGHTPDIAQTVGWRKRQLPLIEKAPVGAITQPVWMMPEVVAALQLRYPQNLMTTLCSLMTALADGDTIILEGQHVREMRQLQIGNSEAHPIEKGRDVIGIARENNSLRSAVNELQDQLKNAKSAPAAASGSSADHALLLAMAEKLGMTLPAPAPQPLTVTAVTAVAAIDPTGLDYREGMEDIYATMQSTRAQFPGQHGADEQRGIPVPQPGRIR